MLLAAALVVGAGGTGAWAWQDGHARTVADSQRSEAQHAAAAASADAGQTAGLAAQAADAAAQGLTDRSRTDLQQAVTAAQAVLDGSAGQVSDDGVRAALTAALAQADQALAGTLAPARAAALTASVAAAATQVTQSQAAWQAAQQAAQAAAREAAAAKARAAATPSPSSSVDPCRTTYTGPLFWTSVPTATGDGSNGNLPASEMTALSWTTDSHGTRFYLLTPAAQALERLNVAFRAAFGHDLDIDLAYRDYATQVRMRAALGTVAAVPGTSPHGLGKAIDVPELPCEYGWSSAQRAWLLTHGREYGWVQPAWALQNGSGPEYWHYEYVG